MAIQIRRTATPDNPPSDLVPGQLAVEMASDPPRLWCGVPATIDPSGRVQVGGGAAAAAADVIGWELVFVDQATITLRRRNGGHIKHNGKLILIPPQGYSFNLNTQRPGEMTQIGPNGMAYIFLRETGVGFISIENVNISATTGHAPSMTPGNEGTEVITFNGVPQDNQTLVGMVRGNANPGWFVDTPRQRFVRTWGMYDRGVSAFANLTADRVLGQNAVWLETHAEIRNEVMLWEGEKLWAQAAGATAQGGSGQANYSAIGFDGTTPEPNHTADYIATANAYASFAVHALRSFSEGYHYATLLGRASGGAGTWGGTVGPLFGRCALQSQTRRG